MAQLVTANTTAGTTLNKAYRKIQGGLLKGFNVMSEEWNMIDTIEDYEITLSAREMTVPIDLNPAGRAAFISEGGQEANPRTVGLEELTLTWANLNARWKTTLTAKFLDSKGQAGQVIRQLRFQAQKALEQISGTVSWQFYGFSTGYACQTSTNATSASQTLTLINAFGVSGVNTAAYLASMFAVGDRIAIIRAGALVANGIGTITAVTPATPSIAVTMIGSCDVDANDYIVFANSVENTTIDGTDYNLAPVGLLDMVSSTSLHGLSGSSLTHWNAALSDSTAGVFSGLKLRKARQAIQNFGDSKPDTVILDQGVHNAFIESERALTRFGSPMGMEVDGSVKSKGIEFFSSRKVPPGYAFVVDKSAIGKYSLLPKPDSGVPPWSDGDKMENVNALQFSVDFPYAFVCKARRKMAVYSNQTTA